MPSGKVARSTGQRDSPITAAPLASAPSVTSSAIAAAQAEVCPASCKGVALHAGLRSRSGGAFSRCEASQNVVREMHKGSGVRARLGRRSRLAARHPGCLSVKPSSLARPLLWVAVHAGASVASRTLMPARTAVVSELCPCFQQSLPVVRACCVGASHVTLLDATWVAIRASPPRRLRNQSHDAASLAHSVPIAWSRIAWLGFRKKCVGWLTWLQL
eukprot:1987101-Rhodomonas_salina.2